MYPPDRKAILICVSLMPSAIGQWKALYNGKSGGGYACAIRIRHTTFIDLNCRMEMCRWRGPFDYLHYYLSAGFPGADCARKCRSVIVPTSGSVFYRRYGSGANDQKYPLSGKTRGASRSAGAGSNCRNSRRSHFAGALRRSKICGHARAWAGIMAKTTSGGDVTRAS